MTSTDHTTEYASPKALAATDALLRRLAEQGTAPEDAPEGLLSAIAAAEREGR